MKKHCTLLFLIFVSGLLSVGFVHATTVENTVSVKASTGGNSAGSESAGSGEASVSIESTVNGKVVQHVEETKQSENGEAVEIETHVEYSDSESDVTIETEASAQAQVEEPINQDKVDDSQAAEHSYESEAEEANNDSTETKPIVVSVIVTFFRNLFSWFFA